MITWLIKLPFRLIRFVLFLPFRLLYALRKLIALVVLIAILIFALHYFDIIEIPGLSVRTPLSVPVTFELILMNAHASHYQYGITGGHGTSGFGATNETLSETFYAVVGQEVVVQGRFTQWNSSEPSFEVVCRILVDDEEIYLAAVQGSGSEEKYLECRGPVYIPDKDE